MNRPATKKLGKRSARVLRFASVAVAGAAALLAIQGPSSPAIAEDIGEGIAASPVQVIHQEQNPWTAGTSSFVQALVDYHDADLPITVTVDWGDESSVTGTFEGRTYVSADELVTLSPAWDVVQPGDPDENLMHAYAAHTYVQPGTYPVTVTVVDGAGERAYEVLSLDVEDAS